MWVTLILLVVGGLNWGLIGLFNYNLVASIFGVGGWLPRTVYALVGLSAVVEFVAALSAPQATAR